MGAAGPSSDSTSMVSERALAIASSGPVVRLALRTSLVVGTLLNVINQGDAMLGQAPLDLAKLLLTYCVPYCVATYSATSISLRVRDA
ncbi:MAG: nitrate/nitrite transporter NrtS [Polyangiales bacterium]